MHKKMICLLLASILLLCGGCSISGTEQKSTTAAKTEATPQQQNTQADIQPQQFSDDAEIAAVWVNAGQYSDGKDFVETMSLLSDGTAIIAMEYQGSDYETLFGTYTALQGVLTVYIEADEPYQRTYQYERDANVLTLYGNDKTVTYRRSD